MIDETTLMLQKFSNDKVKQLSNDETSTHNFITIIFDVEKFNFEFCEKFFTKAIHN